MELTLGRLKAALIAGKIPVTDEALAILRAGLDTITHGYHLNRVLRGIKTETELKKDLSRLYLACRTFVDVLETDLNGLGQIEAMLSATWPGIRVTRLVEVLRLLSPRVEMAIIMAGQDLAKKPRRQNPVTWLFLAAHDLFSQITGEDEPGIAGPLHRFTKRCAALIDTEITVPESENSFHKRLTAALARRTGKIDVLPRAAGRDLVARRFSLREIRAHIRRSAICARCRHPRSSPDYARGLAGVAQAVDRA